MVIQISIDKTEPLAGTAAVEPGAAIPFTGWFELLRAISALVDPAQLAGESSQQGSVEPPARSGQEHSS